MQQNPHEIEEAEVSEGKCRAHFHFQGKQKRKKMQSTRNFNAGMQGNTTKCNYFVKAENVANTEGFPIESQD